MNNQKVSIIVPMFNAQSTIKQCLTSILQQTYCNFEILCVDDGSTDHTKKIVESIAKTDERVKYIYKGNGGVSSARNTGIKQATGYFLQFVDADDKVEKNVTTRLIEEIGNGEFDLVACGYHNNSDKLQISLPPKKYTIKEIAEDFLTLYRSTYLNPPWNKLYKREKIHCFFDESVSLGEDLLFNLNYLLECKIISVIPDMLYVYTTGQENSLTTKYQINEINCLEKKIDNIYEFLKANNTLRLFDYLNEDFWLDYKHCIDNMISCGEFTKQELVDEFSEIRRTKTWNQCFTNFSPKDKSSQTFWNGEYSKYIKRIQIRHLMNHIKSQIKSRK